MEDSFSALVVLFFLLYESSLARLNQKGVCAWRGAVGASNTGRLEPDLFAFRPRLHAWYGTKNTACPYV